MTYFKTLDCLRESLTASEPQEMYSCEIVIDNVIAIFMIYIILNVSSA